MNLQEWVGILGGLAGLAVLAGGILVFLKGSYNKARIEALRQDLSDYKNREEARAKEHAEDLARHERERTDDLHRMEKLETEVKHLSTENSMLRDMVTQRADVALVADQLGSHHQQTIAVLNDIKEALEGR